MILNKEISTKKALTLEVSAKSNDKQFIQKNKIYSLNVSIKNRLFGKC